MGYALPSDPQSRITLKRRPLFNNAVARSILGEVVREVRCKHPFTVDAWVLLPDHLHCIWTLPTTDTDFSLRWNLIKSRFSKRSKQFFHNDTWLNASREKHRESTIWQRRFWEHHIVDEAEYRAYMDYIHFNPVKHGWVQQVVDWPFSTFHQYVRRGIYSQDWGGKRVNLKAKDCGE